jgi:hypothetical protein
MWRAAERIQLLVFMGHRHVFTGTVRSRAKSPSTVLNWLFRVLSPSTARGFALGDVSNKGVKFRLHRRVDDWPIRQFFRWLIPWSSFVNAALKCVCNQSTDLVALERHELLFRIIFVELRAKKHRMNARIKPFDDEEMLRLKQNVVFFYNFLVQRRAGNSKSFRRWPNDGTSLQQNHPVPVSGVIGMNRNQVTWHFSSKQAHGGPVQRPAVRQSKITAWVARSINSVAALFGHLVGVAGPSVRGYSRQDQLNGRP